MNIAAPRGRTSRAVALRRPAYHVGNVRQDLLSAARAILAEQGLGALSLRAIALRAGVAPGTVYYHYADKAALLAGLAIDGFCELATTMQSAHESDPARGGVRTTGGAYLAFLREKPELYALMYEACDGGREDVIAAEAEAMGVSRRAIMEDLGGCYPPDLAAEMAEAIWIWGRGIAATVRARPSQREAAIETAVRGLRALLARW